MRRSVCTLTVTSPLYEDYPQNVPLLADYNAPPHICEPITGCVKSSLAKSTVCNSFIERVNSHGQNDTT